MAKLKLMKKEWMNWFKGTTLENITAWTEYYYINPDSQHWISNYQLWDEETRNGYYSATTGAFTANANYTANKNPISVLPNQTYYVKNTYDMYIFQYDENGNFLGTSNVKHLVNGNGTFVTTSSTAFIAFNINVAVYNKNICFNKSNPSFNGHYEPYIIKIEDILGVADLGDLDYTITFGGLFKTESLVSDIVKGSTPENQKIMCPIYATTSTPVFDTSSPDMTMRLTNQGQLYFQNLSYTDVPSFKQGMSGVPIIYLKAGSPLCLANVTKEP